MKTLAQILVAAAICFSLPAFSQMDDDGIYSPSGGNTSNVAPSQPSHMAPQQSNNSGNNMVPADAPQQQYSYARQDDSTAQKYAGSENYYSDDNNYDYSARIRRYDDNWGDWGYYDDVYTNTYWYSYNPYQYGLSIYMGYPWWGPSAYWCSFYPSYYWGCGLGLGWGWGWPYCGFGYGCGLGYGYGWGWGWGHGWGGYNNYYYNSYERGGAFFGPRTVHNGGFLASREVGTRGVGTAIRTTSFGEMYQNSIHNEATKTSGNFTRSATGAMHMAPSHAVGSTLAARNTAASARPMAAYRTNSNTSTARSASRGYATQGMNSQYNGSRSSASRPSSGRGYSSASPSNSSRLAPAQGGRSQGNYNYHASNSGSRSYGGSNHSFGGGNSGGYHPSGGGHSFGGGGGGGGSHFSGGGGGGGGHSGGGGGHR